MTTIVTIDETSGAANDVGSNSLPYSSGSFPAEFGSVLASLGLSTPDNVALSGYSASTPAGSTVMNFSGSVNDVAFTNATGGALAGAVARSGPGATDFLKTTDGTPIFLYNFTTDLAGVDENNVLLGRKGQLNTHGTADTSDDTYDPDPNGAVVFAAYLDTGTAAVGDAGATAAKVWLVQYQALYHPLGGADHPNDIDLLTNSVYVTVNTASNFSLAGAPSGQNAFLMFGDQGFTGANADKAAVIVTGRDPAGGDTVNTGQGGGTTTIGSNNQMIDPKEGMYFTFVKGPNPDYTVPNLSQTEADLEANILFDSYLSTSGASFVLSQLQPPKGATLKLTALTDAATGTEHGTGFYEGFADDTQVNITSVTITPYDKKGVAGTPVTFASDAGANVTNAAMPGVSLDFSGNTVTIVGLHAGDKIAYAVAGDHNRVLIENAGNGDAKLNASFDIGHFQIATGTIQQSLLGDLAFVDDAPSIMQAGPTDTVVLNTQDADTIGAATDSATESFAAAFGISASSYGADGEGSTGWSYALGVTTDGEAAGMGSNGAAISLYLVEGKVIGSTAASAAAITEANTVFDLAVSAAGAVTLRQFSEIDHAAPGDTADYSAQQAVLGTGLVSLSATALITDGDGDTASATRSIDLGGNLVFDDDGPSITQAEPTDTVVLNTQDADTIGTATDSATESFAAEFGISASSYGADGEGSTGWTYALGVTTDGESANMSSNGAAISLYLVDGKVIGSTATSAAGITAGNTVFDVAVSAAGDVTLQQFAEIDHPAPGDSAGYSAQQAVLGTGLVSLSATALITDGDGDTASATRSIDLGGNLVFDDDGPSITQAEPTDTVVLNTQDADTIGAATDSATESFAAAFGISASSYGADGEGSTGWSYALGVTTDGEPAGMSSNGAAISLYLVEGKVIGSTATSAADITAGNTIFDLAVSAAGDVTLQQFAEIDHEGPGDSAGYSAQQAVLGTGLVSLSATALITDGEGDTASATKSIDLGGNLVFDDDGPSITQVEPTDTVVLNTQDADTIGATTDSATENFAAAFDIASSSYGADGEGSTGWSYALGVTTDGESANMSSNGAAISLYLVEGKVIGSTATSAADITAGNTIFDLAVSAAGAVTLQQFAEIDHAAPGDTADYGAQQAVLGTGLVSLSATALITDGEGDTASATKSIDLGGNVVFDDDGPSASIARTVNTATLDETIGARAGDANAATDDITLANPDPFAAAYGTPIGAVAGVDLVDTTVTTGADSGGATTEVSLAIVGGSGASSGLLTSGGTAINLYLESDGTVTGRTGSSSGSVIFAIAIDADGKVDVAQYAALRHANTSSADDAVDLAGKLEAVVVETDTDGDTATDTVGIGNAIVFEDDGPAIAFGNMVGTGTTVAQHGFWSMSSGSDGLGANGLDIALAGVTLVHPDMSTSAATFTFNELSPSPDASGSYRFGGTLTGDFDNDASTAATSTDFTLTAYADGHYDLDLVQGFSSNVTYDTAAGLTAGGPDPVQTMTIPAPPAAPQATVVFFSALVGATNAQILADVGSGSSDPTEQQLQSPSLAAGIDPRAMNVSLSGIGVSNNLLQGDASQGIGGTDESFVANPDVLCSSVTVVIDNSVGGYSYSGGERLYYRAVYDDGSMDAAYTLVQQDLGLATKGQPTTFTIATAPGKLIDAVQLTMASGDVKIPELLFNKAIGLVDTVKLDFASTVTDKDGDAATDGFSAVLAPAQASSAAFDYVLAGMASAQDAFNVDLALARPDWQVTGFDTGAARDKLVFLGNATASATIDNSGADSIVNVAGTGGQATVVTVVGVDLQASDVSGLAGVSVL